LNKEPAFWVKEARSGVSVFFEWSNVFEFSNVAGFDGVISTEILVFSLGSSLNEN